MAFPGPSLPSPAKEEASLEFSRNAEMFVRNQLTLGRPEVGLVPCVEKSQLNAEDASSYLRKCQFPECPEKQIFKQNSAFK
jgi:hypothetical protein